MTNTQALISALWRLPMMKPVLLALTTWQRKPQASAALFQGNFNNFLLGP